MTTPTLVRIDAVVEELKRAGIEIQIIAADLVGYAVELLVSHNTCGTPECKRETERCVALWLRDMAWNIYNLPAEETVH